jgi:phospholipid/cholesterol/gamma-HCH transport system substrate-binding protein
LNTPEDRRKAGVFLAIALGLLLVLTGILAGTRFLSRDRTYTAEFRESVAGLEPSSPVKYSGVPVGAVTGIRFDPKDMTRILVDFKVRPDVPMKLDTRALLQPQGITGIFYLELHGGTTGAPELEEEDVIPSDPSLSTKIAGIARDLSELVGRLNDFVAKNEANLTYAITDFRASAGSIRSTLEKVDRLADRMGSVLDAAAGTVGEARLAIGDVRTEVKATAEAVRGAVARFDAVVGDPALRDLPGKAGRTLDLLNERVAEADVKGMIEKVNAAVDDFRRIEVHLERAAEGLARAVDEGTGDAAAALAEIRAAATNVKEATRMLKQDPGRILRGAETRDKEAPDPMPPLPRDAQ